MNESRSPCCSLHIEIFSLFLNSCSLKVFKFHVYSENQSVFIHFVPAKKTSLVSVIITKMNVFFINFFAFFINIHFYQALFIKYRSVENLNLFSQSDLFSWIFEYWIFECMCFCVVKTLYQNDCQAWTVTRCFLSINKMLIELIFQQLYYSKDLCVM